MKRLRRIGALIVPILAVVITTAGGQSRVSRAVLGAGGGSSGSETTYISMTVGQTAIGDIRVPENSLHQGFWQRLPASALAGFDSREMPVAGRRALTAGIWPNPSSGTARLVVDNSVAGNISAVLHDMQGNAVRTLYDGACGVQQLAILVDGRDIPSGVYTVVVTSGTERAMVVFHLVQ
jgi:hypothetical protein